MTGHKNVADSRDAMNWSEEEIGEHDWLKNSWVNLKAAVDYWELVMEAFDFARNAALSDRYGRRDDESLGRALSLVRGTIYERMTWAYRDLFMMGHVVNDPKVYAEAKQLAVTRFMRENYSIMRLMDRQNQEPGGYLGTVDEAFRKQAWDGVQEEENRDKFLQGSTDAIQQIDAWLAIQGQSISVAKVQKFLRTLYRDLTKEELDEA